MSNLMRTVSAAIMVATVANLACATEITIHAGDQGRPAGPVCFKPNDLIGRKDVYPLSGPDGKDLVLAQIDEQGRVWWFIGAMKPGETRTYRPHGGILTISTNVVVAVKQVNDGLIEVTIAGKPFTAFNFKKEEPRPYLYPVIGPTGEPVTRDYPMKDNPVESKNKRQDHPHHRSIWTAHGDIRTRDFEHEGSNYWVEHQDMKFNDVQRVTRIVHAVSGPVFGQIEAEVEWIRHDGRRELTDTRTYTFFRGDDDSRIIDVQVMFHFPDEDVMFADTKEGGVVAMRIATSMDETAGGHMVNSKGQKGEKECWGKPAEWCDYVGKVKDETVGIAVFDAKDNFRHPTCWHIRGYGLYTANPFGLGAFTGDKTTNGSKRFKKGESAKFNYRIVIHKGDTQSAHIAEQYQLYADAPKITLK